MFNIFKPRPVRRFIDDTPPRESNLKFTIELKLEANNRGYGENAISTVEVKRTLTSTSDAPVNEIKKELSAIIEGAVSSLEGDIDSTSQLSDGAIAAKKAEENKVS